MPMFNKIDQELQVCFTALGLCVAWQVFVNGAAPLPLCPLEIFLAICGPQHLLDERLIASVAPDIHHQFFSHWNSPEVGADKPILPGSPLSLLIANSLGDDVCVYHLNQSSLTFDSL